MNARPPMPQSLPPALHGFTAFNQWLNYRLTPQPSGKLKKEAIGRGGYRVDPTNPAEWMSYDEAAATGRPLAFSFSESDPFFFLDIDHAREADGSWNALARECLAAFPGCAVETSSSGNGLHIFGVGSTTVPHRAQNDPVGFSLFTRVRFAALTGSDATGDCFKAAPPGVLDAFCLKYLPPTVAEESADWTDEPCEGWSGPTDDDELVRRACRHVSVAAAFAEKASFADLWHCNEDALARSYPSDTDVFNRSSADLALCNHLAFWTGKDCERTARLLRASGLARDKHEREGYVQGTILKSCGLVTDVLHDRPPAVLPPPRPPTPAPAPLSVASAREAKPELVESVGYVRPEQAVELFTGCVYVRDLHKVWVPTGELLKPDAFKVFFGGYKFVTDDVGGKVSDDAFKSFTNNPTLRSPQVSTVCFDPNLEPGAIVKNFKGRDAVNMWVPPIVRCEPGDVTPFLTHVAKLLPIERDRQILLSWMAACVQYVGKKFYWSPVLQGVQGNGKSFFARVMQHAISPEYTFAARSSDLGKDFNAWLEKALFVSVDDVRISDPEMYDRLKPLLTEKTQSIEGKGLDQAAKRVFANFMFSMNDKRNLPKTSSERRFAVFYTAQQKKEDLKRDGMMGSYMTDLHDWANGEGPWAGHGEDYGMACITHYLRNFPIPDDLNPARAGHVAPDTSSSSEAEHAALGPREQEVQELIDTWAVGFRDGWVSSHYGLEALRKRDSRVRVSGLDEVLGNVGYVRHPGLKDGRVHNAVNGEGRIVLYVAKGRMDLLALEGGEIAKAYTEAQSRV